MGGDSADIEGEQAYRAARVVEYVELVSADNADEWYENIVLCASAESNDGATFLSFIEFLKQLPERQPSIVLRYLEKDDRLLSGFLPRFAPRECETMSDERDKA